MLPYITFLNSSISLLFSRRSSGNSSNMLTTVFLHLRCTLSNAASHYPQSYSTSAHFPALRSARRRLPASQSLRLHAPYAQNRRCSHRSRWVARASAPARLSTCRHPALHRCGQLSRSFDCRSLKSPYFNNNASYNEHNTYCDSYHGWASHYLLPFSLSIAAHASFK